MNNNMLATHYNTLSVEEEEESSYSCAECEIPRKLLLHTDQWMPPLEIGFERFEENELDSETILEEEEKQQEQE